MADLVINYTATGDLYKVLDDAYKALFSDSGYESDEGYLTLIDGVYTIPAHTFENIRSLKTMEIPEGVVSFGAKAFMSSSLKELIIPNKFRSVAVNALSVAGGKMYKITCYANEVVEIDTQDVSIDEMYVYEDMLEAYQHSAWAEYVKEWETIERPEPPTPSRKGFNFDGMIDKDYMWQLGRPIKL